ILGAVLFLILPFLVGGMGFSRMLLIVVIAHSATIATSFSIADCTSNVTRIGSGGMFAISKQTLGKAFGGSIGIQLFLAQALSIGFYVIGFAGTLQAVLIQIPQIYTFTEQNGLNTMRQIQFIAAVLGSIALILALIGADFIVKIQMIIFLILSISVGAILISPLIPQTRELFTGSINMSGSGLSIGFWGAFAMFFPAVTGIDAGVGMSGQLKNPRRSLGRGTFLAIGVTFLAYILLVFVFSLIDPSRLILPGEQPVSAVQLFTHLPFMQLIILLGILFATGSSTLSYLMTAPRTVQALAADGLLPKFLSFLKYDFRRGGNEPRWATLITFLMFMPIIAAGNIQFASTVVGISFLTVYGWVNMAAFLERISGNPSFRPTAKGHWLISLYGFFICILGIALFNALIGLAVLVFQFGIFFLLLRYRSGNRLEGIWWGVLFKIIQWDFRHISKIIQGTKNWRPIMQSFGYADRAGTLHNILGIADQISTYKGLTMMNIFCIDEATDTSAGSDTGGSQRLLEEASYIHLPQNEVECAITTIAQSDLPGNFQTNTVLLPMDRRLNLLRIINNLIHQKKHVLLYLDGEYDGEKKYIGDEKPRIDIWWKGEGNGNLMSLLAYIITQSEIESWAGIKPSDLHIRLIRKLSPEEDETVLAEELRELMYNARLSGELVTLPADGNDFHKTVREHSSDAVLIMQGMPGEKASGLKKFFSIDELFFSHYFELYKDMPSMLFIKAAYTITLHE
ncbi:MAG: amino acid permease, partial [Salinispira sp.]